MTYEFDDGGRKAAGWKGKGGDCVTRAIAIAKAMRSMGTGEGYIYTTHPVRVPISCLARGVLPACCSTSHGFLQRAVYAVAGEHVRGLSPEPGAERRQVAVPRPS